MADPTKAEPLSTADAATFLVVSTADAAKFFDVSTVADTVFATVSTINKPKINKHDRTVL